MSVIGEADLDGDHWATTEDVREEFQIEVGNQEPDFERRIKQATRSIRARWSDTTGKAVTDAPDTMSDIPELLRDATAYLAASKAHLAYAANVSGQNNGDDRHVFLSNEADRAFDDWVQQADLDAEGDAGDDVGIGTVSGRRGSLTDDII